MDYAGLQTAVAQWMARADLTARIPDFIDLAEARINRLIVKHGFGEVATAALAAADEWVVLPDDFACARLLVLDSATQRVLDYKTPERLIADYPSTAQGQPRWYTLHGSEIQLRPIPDGDYDLLIYYYTKVPALSDLVTTNWMLTNHPDVYLYATLLEAAPFVQDQSSTMVWKTGYDIAVADLLSHDNNRNWSGGTLQMRVA